MTGPGFARTLVIGGSGFIGRHLVPFLKKDPFYGEIVAPSRAELDLGDQDRLCQVLADIKPTSIINLAGYATIRSVDVADLFGRNTVSVVNLLSAVARLQQRPRIIVCSSAYVYAANATEKLTENSLLEPRNLYAVSKVAAEMSISITKGDLDVTTVRIFNATGVGQSTEFLLPKVISTLVFGNLPLFLNNLSDRRDFIDVRDLCQMFSVVLKTSAPPPVINFCNGCSVSISQIIDTLSGLVGFSIPVASSNSSSRTSTVQGDNSLLRSLGYQRRYQMVDTLSWMLAHAEQSKNIVNKSSP